MARKPSELATDFDHFVNEVRQAYTRTRPYSEGDSGPVEVRRVRADCAVGEWIQTATFFAVSGESEASQGVEDVLADVMFAGGVGLQASKYDMLIGAREPDTPSGFSDVLEAVSYDGGDPNSWSFIGVQLPSDVVHAAHDLVKDRIKTEADLLAGGARIISWLGQHPEGTELVAGYEESSDLCIARGHAVTHRLPLIGDYTHMPILE
jgi:hypothetical protein